MDFDTSRKLKAHFEEVKKVIVLRDLWKSAQAIKGTFEYNTSESTLGSGTTVEVLTALAADGVLESVSDVTEQDVGGLIERWHTIAVTEPMNVLYNDFVHHLPMTSSAVACNEVADSVKRELQLQCERGVPDCLIGYESLPDGFLTKGNLYYALLLMEVENFITIHEIEDRSKWFPNTRNPEKQYVYNFVFRVRPTDIPHNAKPTKADISDELTFDWKELKATFPSEHGCHPRVYKSGTLLTSGGGKEQLRACDIKVLAALIRGGGRTLQHHALIAAMNPDPNHDEFDIKERALHDSIRRLRKFAGIDCIENERKRGYKLVK
ncbi:MAG: helix-turn-helix domain-containing protein [Candidatus Peregrinibacteria bacterium]|nr:helix-turn-helix domain-containing protein [Candidatus Peregrinibacteria bacterium]MCB9808325.1 helix-turn-helix domain-containing protein [Candidatus Peribacteria bacterium]